MRERFEDSPSSAAIDEATLEATNQQLEKHTCVDLCFRFVLAGQGGASIACRKVGGCGRVGHSTRGCLKTSTARTVSIFNLEATFRRLPKDGWQV